MAAPPRRGYHKVVLGKSEFEVDVRYVNLKPIGRGAYGLVAAADDLVTGNKVAIKRVSRVFQDLIDAKRILREIKLLRHLGQHENIIELLDLMTCPPDTEDFHTLYIVSSLFECDLERIISSSQKLTDQHAQYFVYQILRGLKYIHSAHVLHRDLKPSNLLVNSNCDLAICDFGLARGIDGAVNSKLTEYVVTRWYRAPELLTECDVYGAPVDIWALGCIFAELLGRKPLFKGHSTREQLELIISKLGTPTPEDLRWVTSRAVLESIRRMPPHQPVPWEELLPGASPLALDLLSKMLTFDQAKRYTIRQCLEHPYLHDLHQRARETLCGSYFDWSFENGYPDEMPQPLLQRMMFADMMTLREEQQARSGLQAGALPLSLPDPTSVPAGSDPEAHAAMVTAMQHQAAAQLLQQQAQASAAAAAAAAASAAAQAAAEAADRSAS